MTEALTVLVYVCLGVLIGRAFYRETDDVSVSSAAAMVWPLFLVGCACYFAITWRNK